MLDYYYNQIVLQTGSNPLWETQHYHLQFEEQVGSRTKSFLDSRSVFENLTQIQMEVSGILFSFFYKDIAIINTLYEYRLLDILI